MKRSDTGPVHISAVVIPLFLSVAGSAVAQSAAGTSPAASARPDFPDRPWSIAPAVSLVTFSAIGAESPGAEAALGRATSAGVSVRRHTGPVALTLSLDFLSALLQVRDEAVMVEARSPAVARSRIGFSAGREVARVGTGRVAVEGGPTLDVWSPDGSETRARAGAAVRLVLGVDTGPFAVEQSVGVGVSASPLASGELPAGYERRTMRTVTVALAARIGL